MYNFAKLLTDEPERIEKIVILFLKFFLTLFITNYLCETKIAIDEIIKNPIPNKLSQLNILVFITSFILIWFVFWEIVVHLFYFVLKIGIKLALFLILLIPEIIRLVVRYYKKATPKLDKICQFHFEQLVNDEKSFLFAIEVLQIAKESKAKKEKSNRRTFVLMNNIIPFSEALHDYENDEFISTTKGRMYQYFIICISILGVLLFVPEAKDWDSLRNTLIVAASALFIIIVFIHRVHRYMDENIEILRIEFARWAYRKRILNALNQNKYLKRYFHFSTAKYKIILKSKEGHEFLPASIRIFPLFHSNEKLGEYKIGDDLKRLSLKDRKVNDSSFDVIFTNVKENEGIKEALTILSNFRYITCETDKDINVNLELCLYELTKGHYRTIGIL